MTEIEVQQLGEDRGGGMTEVVSWVPDRSVTLAELARIDALHVSFPTCRLCGQRCIRLDNTGLCSKVSPPHQQWRSEVSEKGGAR